MEELRGSTGRPVLAVDSDVWRIMDSVRVRALLREEFEVLDREPDAPLVFGAILVTVCSDAEALAAFRQQGATGVVSVQPGVAIGERAKLVALVLSAGADYCLIGPTPADFVAHARALARRLQSW